MRTTLLGLAIVLAGCPGAKSTPAPTTPTATSETTTPPPDEAAMIGHADGQHGYCRMVPQGICGEFPPDQVAEGVQACEGRGEWSTAGCPAEGVLGVCTNPVRGGGARLWLYAPRFASAEAARSEMCSDEDDVFTPQ
jgi:hypothetical protein